MKTKYSIIPFIPAVIAAVGLKIMSMFAMDGNGLLFGMNKSSINYCVIGISLGLFALCVLVNLFDRRTAPVCPVKRNVVSGTLAILSGVAIVGSSFLTLLNTTAGNSEGYLLSILVALFSIPAAIAMVMISKVHFTGKTIVSNASMFFVFPALWGCCGLVSEFIAATKVSISASDMTPLFCYIFITLYLFSSSMVVSRVKGKNPVKACFIYGLPAATVSLAYGVGAVLTSSVENTGVSALVNGIMFIILAAYIVSFTVEMFTDCLTKAEVEIIDSLPEDEDTYENSYISSGGYDELVVSDKKEDDVPASDDSYETVAQGLSDFVMGYDEEKYDDATIKNENINDGLVLGYGDENQTQLAEEIVAEPEKEKTAEPVKEKTVKPVEKNTAKPVKKSPAKSVKKTTAKPVKESPAKSVEKITAKPAEENSARSVKNISAEPEIHEEFKDARRINTPEKKPEPVKAEAPVKAPVEDTEVSDDRMSEIDRLLKELEDKK